jgi:hypothetical protein
LKADTNERKNQKENHTVGQQFKIIEWHRQIGIHHRTGSPVDSIGKQSQDRIIPDTRLCQQPLAGAQIQS